MKLELYDENLKPEYQSLLCRAIWFEHLTDEAQVAVRAVGRDTFYRDRGIRLKNYNLIYAPKDGNK
jgi:hypothetical protein